MKDLIEALTILLKYGDHYYPTFCDRELLTISCINPADVSVEDKERLEELGFFAGVPFGDACFFSYRFGSY